MPELVDHVDGEGEDANSSEDDQQNPPEERHQSYDINSERSLQLECGLAKGGIERVKVDGGLRGSRGHRHSLYGQVDKFQEIPGDEQDEDGDDVG